METIQGSYDQIMVGLSILAAIIASYISIDFIGLCSQTEKDSEKYKWRILVSICLGTGIWCMHFIGIYAYRLPIIIHYDGIETLASLIIAILACYLGIGYLRIASIANLMIGACFMGGGISIMHYLGMHAMHMAATSQYNIAIVSFSVVIGVIVSGASLHVIRKLLHREIESSISNKLAGAILMGSAISSMHYIGMASVTYTRIPAITEKQHLFIIDDNYIVGGLAIAAFLLFFLSLYITSYERVIQKRLHKETAQLKASENRMRALLDNVADAVTVINEEGSIELFNKSAEKMFGYSREEIIGKNISVLMKKHEGDYHHRHLRNHMESGEAKIIGKGARQLIAIDKEGNEHTIGLSVNRIETETGVQFIGVMRDMTAHKTELDKLTQLADHDALTGLVNRRKLLSLLEHSTLVAKRSQSLIGLMFIDLDGFKEVNDTLGHAAGDELLKQVALQLTEETRESDIVARLGGDEFCIVMEYLKSETGAARLAENIINSFQHPFHIADSLASVTASIGVAIFPRDAENHHDLMKNADSAMYEAKHSGKNKYCFFKASAD